MPGRVRWGNVGLVAVVAGVVAGPRVGSPVALAGGGEVAGVGWGGSVGLVAVVGGVVAWPRLESPVALPGGGVVPVVGGGSAAPPRVAPLATPRRRAEPRRTAPVRERDEWRRRRVAPRRPAGP